jgi:hypothetical protein
VTDDIIFPLIVLVGSLAVISKFAEAVSMK